MKSNIPGTETPKTPDSSGGRTRPPEAPLDKELSDAFREVEPAGFGDDPRSSIEAAAVDPDVDDSEGGE